MITLIFFYKHLVYKHAQPQILGKFKHIAKHAPGWDFQFEKKKFCTFGKICYFYILLIGISQKPIETSIEIVIIYNINLSVYSGFWY